MKSVVNAKDIYGDTLDYLSHGAMEIMQREIWDRYPQAMASHDMTRKMQGKVIDPTPREEREKILQDFWPTISSMPPGF